MLFQFNQLRGHTFVMTQKHTMFGKENSEMNNVQIGRTRILDETEKNTPLYKKKRLQKKKKYLLGFLVIMTRNSD